MRLTVGYCTYGELIFTEEMYVLEPHLICNLKLLPQFSSDWLSKLFRVSSLAYPSKRFCRPLSGSLAPSSYCRFILLAPDWEPACVSLIGCQFLLAGLISAFMV